MKYCLPVKHIRKIIKHILLYWSIELNYPGTTGFYRTTKIRMFQIHGALLEYFQSTSIQEFIQNVHKKHQRFKSCLLKGRDRLSDFLVAFFFCVAVGSSGINRPRNIFRLGSYSWYIRSSSSSISCRYSS